MQVWITKQKSYLESQSKVTERAALQLIFVSKEIEAYKNHIVVLRRQEILSTTGIGILVGIALPLRFVARPLLVGRCRAFLLGRLNFL